MVTAWIDLFLGWSREDWLSAQSHFQLADVLESTEHPVGATQIIRTWEEQKSSSGEKKLCLLGANVILGTGCIPLFACDHSGIVPWKRFHFQLIFLYERSVGV